MTTEQHNSLDVDMPAGELRVCSVKAFCEVLSEEYPAPVCNDCCVTMLVRTEVFRGDEGSHIEVRCGFRCTNCYSILSCRFEKKRPPCNTRSISYFAER